jgi:hypothetical protein
MQGYLTSYLRSGEQYRVLSYLLLATSAIRIRALLKMESLCSFCDPIRFSVLGFHVPMFHPNSPVDSDDSYQPRGEPWQESRKTPLGNILDNRES